MLEKGTLDELPKELLKNTLCAEARDSFGRIDPACVGGEYLPDYGLGETEIARLELRSMTADVISFRARCDAVLIHYSIVDEYGTEFELQRKRSRKPLTLAELVRFIDGGCHPDLAAGLALGYNEMNNGGDRESLRDFTKVSSDVYNRLEEPYEHVFEEWAEESG
jgi:hypothetical protein